MAYIRIISLLLLAGLTACSVNNDDPVRASHPVTGTVQVPAQLLAAVQPQHTGMLARLLALVSSTSWADISGTIGGLVPVSGVTVELVRLNYVAATDSFYETVVACDGGCPVTASDGSFTIYTSESPSSTLALKVSFIDPVDGVTPIVMRAMVYGDSVDVTPISEAAAQIMIDSLNQYVLLDNYTVNEVDALINLIEDEGIDVSGLNFTEAIDKIKLDADDILGRFIIGFQAGGEMNVANPNDIFHIVELRNRLVAPNVTFPVGAVDYEATTGGAVSFDNNGDFQIGSALYYWGLRSQFSGSPVRLFDQALNELDQTPASPSYDIVLTYGVPVGFRGITAADNGMAVANSDTEATAFGFLSNDGGMLALLSERNDDTQSIYDRGLRILMRKWKEEQFTVYNDVYNNNTINYTDGISDYNNNNNTQSSIDLNGVMDDPNITGDTNYNVVMYQHFLNDSGVEIGAGTGQWGFSTDVQQIVTDTSVAPSERFHGEVTVASQNLDAAQYQYATGTLTPAAVKTLEPCPNLFVVTPGGTMMMRRDTNNSLCNGVSANIFAGTGAVTSDGEVFVIPQVFDDSEDNVELEHAMPAGFAARRGWYIGVRQPDVLSPLTNAHLNGIYHVVGQVTEFDDSIDSVSHESFHGSLNFTGADVGGGNMLLDGSLHRKSSTMDAVGTAGSILSSTPSLRVDITNGTYQAAANGTVDITLPGTTETVTGVAGQVINYNGSDIAMFMAVPIKRDSAGKSARGIMLLAHEFLVEYPIPPDPPGPPTPPVPPP